MKKYGHGWYNESKRHRLARLGVKTGRKVNYQKLNDMSYQPVSISTGISEEMKKPIMSDVDDIVAEAQTEAFVSDESTPLLPIDDEEIEEKVEEDISEVDDDDIDTELVELEEIDEGTVLQEPWSKKLGNKIKDLYAKGVRSYKDTNISGIDEHVNSLEEEKMTLQDRLNILSELKQRILNKGYKEKVGTKKQLDQLKRINNLLGEPSMHLRTINSTIENLNHRKTVLQQPRPVGEKKVAGYSSVFPTFGEILHPERLMNEKPRRKKKKDEFSIFPSFDEVLHPEKIR